LPFDRVAPWLSRHRDRMDKALRIGVRARWPHWQPGVGAAAPVWSWGRNGALGLGPLCL